MRRVLVLLALLMLTVLPATYAMDGCCVDLSLEADYLYWRVGRSSSSLTASSSMGRDETLSSEYDSGVRFGAFLERNCWDFGIRYTYYDHARDESFFGGIPLNRAILFTHTVPECVKLSFFYVLDGKKLQSLLKDAIASSFSIYIQLPFRNILTSLGRHSTESL